MSHELIGERLRILYIYLKFIYYRSSVGMKLKLEIGNANWEKAAGGEKRETERKIMSQ